MAGTVGGLGKAPRAPSGRITEYMAPVSTDCPGVLRVRYLDAPYNASGGGWGLGENYLIRTTVRGKGTE